MEIEQQFTVPFPRDRVWATFHDFEAIVGCLPGASLSAPPEGNDLALQMTVKLGPIVANFAGKGEIALDEAALSGAVTGSGADRRSGSRVKGCAAFALHEEAEATRVEVKVDFSIAGSLAQFSRGGIVRELATRMTEAFAANLKARLEADAPATPAPAKPAAAATAHDAVADTVVAAQQPLAPTQSKPPQNAPLDAGSLLWRVFLDRTKRLFRRWRKHNAH